MAKLRENILKQGQAIDIHYGSFELYARHLQQIS